MPKRPPEFAAVVKRQAIMAMFSDDELMDQLVLKGGTLLDVVYKISSRASFDLDFSVAGVLGDVNTLRARIERTLTLTFSEINYEVFDVSVREVPLDLSAELADFWGGYQIDFKIIERDLFRQLAGNIEQIRRNAASVGKRGSTKLEIDISKHEYCDGKQATQLDHLTIFTYSPEMVVCEKLRSICQQMPEYTSLVRKHSSARARDFLDIHTVSASMNVNFEAAEFADLLPKVFEAKRVPLRLLGRIAEYYDYHLQDFEAVRATVRPNFPLRTFNVYFDFVVSNVNRLKPLWNK